MVDIYSPSGKEEDLCDFLQAYLKRHGLPVKTQSVDDRRSNLLVIPPETEIQLAFIGHLDTVAAYELDD
jgi:acetylornithine deacetylase